MRIAVLADIHANLAALQAVLADLARRGPDMLLCLGDFVGYYAEPNECIALLRERAVGVAGNHDLAVLGEPAQHTNPIAYRTHEWTRQRLRPDARDFLAGLARRCRFAWGSAVHGCLINPAHATGYITSTTASWNLEWLETHERSPHITFFGHTHMPALYVAGQEELSGTLEGEFRLPRGHMILANPGAVGQPRDGDARAAYAIFDDSAWTLEYRRVGYDIERTSQKVEEAGFDESLRNRLRQGR